MISYDMIIGILTGINLVLVVVSICMGFWAVVSAKALQNSTHTMIRDMKPIEPYQFGGTEQDAQLQFEEANTQFFVDPIDKEVRSDGEL